MIIRDSGLIIERIVGFTYLKIKFQVFYTRYLLKININNIFFSILNYFQWIKRITIIFS